MISINITGADAAVTQTETLTAGRVGLECTFSFDSAWDGLSKIAVCEGADTRSVVMDSDTIIVPWECLADPGYKLRIGVRGENSAGDIVIPTVWARVGKISDSPGDDIDPGQEATPSVVQQIQETAANALYIARGVRADADSGAFIGPEGPQGPQGNTGPQGPQGPQGETGDPGVYIGNVTPTDPSISVWIDTSEGSVDIHGLPSGGTTGQVLKKTSGTDFAVEWSDESGVSITVDDELSSSSTNPVQNKIIKTALDGKGTYSKPSGGIPSSDMTSAVQTSLGKADTAYQKPSGGIPGTDLASGVIPIVPSAYTSNPAMDGTASAGSSTAWARGDHVHPTDTSRAAAADVHSIPSGGTSGQVLKKASGTDYDVAWGNESGGGGSGTSDYTDLSNKPSINSVTLSGNKTAYDLSLAPAVVEVTDSDTGALVKALDAGKIYHFTGSLTALTISLNAAASGQLAQYHFDFTMPSTVFTPTLTGVTLPSSHTWEASKRYEVDVLNGYGVVMAW